MKTKTKMIFAVTLATLVFGASSPPAAAEVASTNAARTAVDTNTNPETTMTALFGDPVIAKGKGFEIKRSQLDELLTGAKANAAAAGQVLPPVFEIQILDQLIFVQLMLQKATDADKIEGKRKAELQFTNLVKRLGTLAAVERQLKAVGMTVSELRARAEQEAVARVTLQRELHVSVTDVEAKEYYSNNPAVFEQPERARVCDILLLTINPDTRTPLSSDQQQAKRQRMDELLKRARSGENFTNLAAMYSDDLISKDNGGELPPVSRDQMPPELEAVVFSLTNNQISDVIDLPYGCCIVKLLEKIPAKKEPFAGLDTNTTFRKDNGQYATIREVLSDKFMQKQAPAYLSKLRKEADVGILDPKLKALEAAVEAAASNSPAMTPEK